MSPLSQNSSPHDEMRPRVIGSFAMTADGKIATVEREPSGFTSPLDKARFRKIRALGDAILVGRKTLETDSMSMTISDPHLRAERVTRGQSEFPLRIIVSSSGKLSPSSRIFSVEGGQIVLLTSPASASRARASTDLPRSVFVREIPESGLREALCVLGREFGLRTVICEGGGALFRSLVSVGCIDELYLTIAPVIFGGADAPSLTGVPGDFLPSPTRFELISMESIEGEVYCHFVVI